MTKEEAVKEIEKAFEPAFANYIITALTEGATVSDKEPTTKNNLGVDCISRADVLRIMRVNQFIHDGEWAMKWSMNEIKDLPSVTSQEPKTGQFAKWVATEIFDDMWEYNKDAFAEIACRKLEKLDIVRAKGDEWELVESEEGEAKE